MEFRKKPVVIEAFQFKQPTGVGDAPEWLTEAVMKNDFLVVDGVAHITTLEGIMTAKPGDWIIRGVKGEIYSCKPDIFAATYECATPPSPSTAPTVEVGEPSAYMGLDGKVYSASVGRICVTDEPLYLHAALASRSAASTARDLLDAMTDGERMELLGHYCKFCGCKDPSCQCWNDE
jgi:hypothetical protein